jgi:hypothetical protein
MNGGPRSCYARMPGRRFTDADLDCLQLSSPGCGVMIGILIGPHLVLAASGPIDTQMSGALVSSSVTCAQDLASV